MSEVPNEKAEAWQHVGGLFWTHGRATARPSQAEIDQFLDGAGAADCVVVVGASTKELVEAAASRVRCVVVLDFSSRMIDDLREHLPEGMAELHVIDITQPPPAALRGIAELVLSDRLINRFTRTEAAQAFQSMLALAKPGGEVRTSVKIGLYDMDRRMIEEAERSGCLEGVWDPASRTIDFSHSDKVLERAVLPHGEIPRDVLLAWYRGRRKETRFERSDIFEIASGLSHPPERVEWAPFPDAPATEMFLLRRSAG